MMPPNGSDAEENETNSSVTAGLPHEMAPPSGLEDRLVAELARRGRIAREPESGGSVRSMWRIAATALVAFALGILLGPRLSTPRSERASVAGESRYLILLYEPQPLDRGESDLVAEYRAWAGELASRGQLVSGEKLDASAFGFGPVASAEVAPPGERGEPTGFFLIRASGLEEAERIARDCPHLRHGGELSLRPVDPT